MISTESAKLKGEISRKFGTIPVPFAPRISSLAKTDTRVSVSPRHSSPRDSFARFRCHPRKLVVAHARLPRLRDLRKLFTNAQRRRYFLPARINFSPGSSWNSRAFSFSWRKRRRRRRRSISRSTSFAKVLSEMEIAREWARGGEGEEER